jgi:hypothetical protein
MTSSKAFAKASNATSAHCTADMITAAVPSRTTNLDPRDSPPPARCSADSSRRASGDMRECRRLRVATDSPGSACGVSADGRRSRAPSAHTRAITHRRLGAHIDSQSNALSLATLSRRRRRPAADEPRGCNAKHIIITQRPSQRRTSVSLSTETTFKRITRNSNTTYRLQHDDDAEHIANTMA